MEMELHQFIAGAAIKNETARRIVNLDGVAVVADLERHIFIVKLDRLDFRDHRIADIDRRLPRAGLAGGKLGLHVAPAEGRVFTFVVPMRVMRLVCQCAAGRTGGGGCGAHTRRMLGGHRCADARLHDTGGHHGAGFVAAISERRNRLGGCGGRCAAVRSSGSGRRFAAVRRGRFGPGWRSFGGFRRPLPGRLRIRLFNCRRCGLVGWLDKRRHGRCRYVMGVRLGAHDAGLECGGWRAIHVTRVGRRAVGRRRRGTARTRGTRFGDRVAQARQHPLLAGFRHHGTGFAVALDRSDLAAVVVEVAAHQYRGGLLAAVHAHLLLHRAIHEIGAGLGGGLLRIGMLHPAGHGAVLAHRRTRIDFGLYAGVGMDNLPGGAERGTGDGTGGGCDCQGENSGSCHASLQECQARRTGAASWFGDSGLSAIGQGN